MPKLPILFLATAAGCLVVGVGMGIAMGISHDFRLAPVHAHLNLLGWASLALMGLAHRAYPDLAPTRAWGVAQFALSAGSAVLFPIGLFLAIARGAPALAISAALAYFAGAALFLGLLLRLAFRGATGPARDARTALASAG